MTKPYSKSAKSRGYGSSNNLGSSIAQGANIETLRYQNEAALPTQSENDAQLFADIGKGFSAPGDRPRGGLRNFGAGIAKGLEYGAKSNAIGERKENYDKYANVMNYLQEANNAAIEQNQWYEKRESARKQMMPQVLAYMDNIDKLDPQSQRIMAQDMLAQYGEALGEEYKLSSIDGSNPFLVTIQTPKGQQLFDLRSLFAGDEVMQQAISMKMPEYQMKLQKERQEKLKKFEQDQEKIDLMKFDKGVPGGQFGTKQEAQGQEIGDFEYNGHKYDVVPLNGREKGEITDYGKTVNKAVSQVSTNENAIKAVNTMRDVFERNPNIGESWVNMLSSGDDEDTWGRWISKKFQSRQERADMEILKKASSDLNLSTVLSIPGKSATDILKRAIQASSPTGTLTKQAFDKVADDWETRAIDNIDTAKAMAHARAENKMIVSKSNANKQSQGFKGESRVPIFDPETKKQLGTISNNEIDQARDDGFLVGEVS
jgi:hypothetical protein